MQTHVKMLAPDRMGGVESGTAMIDLVGLLVWLAIVGTLFALGVLSARYPWLERFLDSALRRLVAAPLLLAAALSPGLALYWLASLVSPDSLATGIPVLAVLVGVVGLLSWMLSTDERRRTFFERTGRLTVGIATPFAVAWTFLLAALGLFAAITFVLYDAGAVALTLVARRGPLQSGHLVDFYMWHVLESVPLLRVPETLRWELPVTYESALVGWLLLAFKLFVIVPMIGIFRTYWQIRKRRADAGQEQLERPAPEPTAVS